MGTPILNRRWVIRPIAGVPDPYTLFRASGCLLAGGPETQRPAGCCWYHMVDWRAAFEAAVRIVTDAAAASDWRVPGVDVLLERPLSIVRSENGSEFIEDGQHRLTAMRQQGLTRVLVLMDEGHAPPTGSTVL